jgi:hypothetical protein
VLAGSDGFPSAGWVDGRQQWRHVLAGPQSWQLQRRSRELDDHDADPARLIGEFR